ncbi:uncharacterized protein LOC134836571 [Culicoides brevitarsis]|uniref:uncharacterized protein LOC134836571 n=1 Tax=Culicoides brevitarsis TaxID=469753 RepID=UPI00307CB2D7
MAIDLLVAALLLCSASVNLLALGAFWVTPSLRNGLANRFVVNLLIVNLVCCVVLAPSLLLNSITFDAVDIPATSFPVVATTQVVPDVGRFAPNDSTDCVRHNNCTENNLAATDEIQSEYIRDKFRFTQIRCWGLDFAAAVGALSVLLVVGDTWCAVTDPLRYHTRLSDKKAWIFVFLAWAIGIMFGVASAFRSDQTNMMNEPDDVYNAIFSYSYFTLAILLPFVMVCTMYWRIYSEARESGQRMRQNGSSPLLQSALNLAQVSAATAHTQVQQDKLPQQLNTGGITGALSSSLIETKVSNENVSSNNEKSDESEKEEAVIEPLLLKNNTYNLNNNQMLCERRASDSQQQQEQRNFHLSLDNKPFFKSDDNQNNILLTLTTTTTTDQMRRNFSAKQLESLDASPVRPEMRHATSTPNLHKLDKYDLHPRLVLPLPTVNVPPKALSYMTSIRHRLSNASSLFKYREESRAARISILVVVMFLVSYLPYGILVLMQGHNDFLEASDQSLLAIFAVVLANLSSPFIFAYRNKRVRRGIFRLLGVDKQKAHDRFQKFQNSTIRRKTSPNFATNVNRSTSRASTYSATSCKYLTVAPHATAVTLNGSYIVEIDKLSPCFEEQSSFTATPVPSPVSIAPVHGSPYKQTTISISSKPETEKIKKSILKRVCDTSKMWGCNCVDNSSISKHINEKKLNIKQPTLV